MNRDPIVNRNLTRWGLEWITKYLSWRSSRYIYCFLASNFSLPQCYKVVWTERLLLSQVKGRNNKDNCYEALMVSKTVIGRATGERSRLSFIYIDIRLKWYYLKRLLLSENQEKKLCVCLAGWSAGWLTGWMDEWMGWWMDGWINKRMEKENDDI